MRYAKIIDGQTIYAPPSLMIGEQWFGNPTDEQYRAEGYEPVDEPDIAALAEQNAMLEACLLEMSELVYA